ncbi:MAG: winged helix DNA-binding domain-containing protein [Tannerellaceae bacterium]|nr:winged helix DNA-binding domain-containing protein [Tannerellaceae bacterium]
MIPHIRLTNQQLGNPLFNDPKELVTWMGAIQAQDYTMVKWAIGMRLQQGNLQMVENAINKGDIIRTHVMRPTWHFVPAEDLKWMLQLSLKRNKSAYESYARQLEFPLSSYSKGIDKVCEMLQGNNHLTKQEIKTEFNNLGFELDTSHVTWLVTKAEMEGILCSGPDKAKNPTYALIDERITKSRELTKEESLALLATRYFQSHSPATLADFVWWSGLTITEARLAVSLIQDVLIKENYRDTEFIIHSNSPQEKTYDNILHFLPSYDEFLISYKDRTDVLAPEHTSRAFNTFGIFYPVILHNGQIVGNWKKSSRKGEIHVESSFFQSPIKCKKLINTAEKRFKDFLKG